MIKKILGFVLVVILMGGVVWANVEPKISFQGRLTDPQSGAPVTSANVRFRLYNAETGGSAVWNTSENAVTADSNGFFSLLLGESPWSDLSATDFHQALWLQVEIDGNALEPRQPLAAAPYAIALTEGNKTIGGNLTVDGFVHSEYPNIGLAMHGKSTAGNVLGFGVKGEATGNGFGVHGLSETGIGVWGHSSGGGWGVSGTTNSNDNPAVLGINSGEGPGLKGSSEGYAVYGYSRGSGNSAAGVWGQSVDGRGVSGRSENYWGVYGYSPTSKGVYGYSNSGYGVHGFSSSGRGVYGKSNSGYAIYGEGPIGIYGGGTGSGSGVTAYSPSGKAVYGSSDSGYGGYFDGKVRITGDTDIYGEVDVEKFDAANVIAVEAKVGGNNIKTAVAVKGYVDPNSPYDPAGNVNKAIYGDCGPGKGWAGYFDGDVEVTGDFNVSGTKNFVIDHPTDPQNKILRHAAVESPDIKNVYDGTIVLNDKGEAEVKLPEYFGVLNGDFRYQLTTVGEYSPVYVKKEISNNIFTIAGGKPGMKVCWQVTGIRQDAYALKNPLIVEENKTLMGKYRKGEYLNPEAFEAVSAK